MSKQEFGNTDPRQIQPAMRQGESNIALMYEAVSPLTGPFDSPLVGPFRSPLIGEFLVGGPSGGAAPLNVGSFTDGDLLIGSSSTGRVSRAKLTAGSNVTITNAPGAITIAAEGGGSLAGYGPVFPLTDPTLQTWSWVNQGTGSVTTVDLAGNNVIVLEAPTTAGRDLRIRVKTVPSTPYSIKVLVMVGRATWGRYGACGLCWRESSSGKLHLSGSFINGFAQSTATVDSEKWTNPTTPSAAYNQSAGLPTAGFMGLAISDDGSNRKTWYSTDGNRYALYDTRTHTDFLTPNQVGFFAEGFDNGYTWLTILSWKETANADPNA